MPTRRQTYSRRCPYCGDRFTTSNPRRKYDDPKCRKMVHYNRLRDKLRRATEILKKQAEL